MAATRPPAAFATKEYSPSPRQIADAPLLRLWPAGEPRCPQLREEVVGGSRRGQQHERVATGAHVRRQAVGEPLRQILRPERLVQPIPRDTGVVRRVEQDHVEALTRDLGHLPLTELTAGGTVADAYLDAGVDSPETRRAYARALVAAFTVLAVDSLADLNETRPTAAELHGARLEPAITLVDDDKLAIPAVNHGAVRHAQHWQSAAGVDFGFRIHIGPENKIRILKLDPHPHRPCGRIEMRINQRHLSRKNPVGIAAHAHSDRLVLGNGRELRFRDIDQSPYDGMIGDAKQHVAGPDPHALDHVALKHDAIAGRYPRDGRRHLFGALDIGENLLRNGEIQKALGGTLHARRGKILCGGRRDCGTVKPKQWLALAHFAAGGDVFNRLNE